MVGVLGGLQARMATASTNNATTLDRSLFTGHLLDFVLLLMPLQPGLTTSHIPRCRFEHPNC